MSLKTNLIITPSPADDKASKAPPLKQQPKQQNTPQGTGLMTYGMGGITPQPQPKDATFNPSQFTPNSVDVRAKEEQPRVAANNSNPEGARGGNPQVIANPQVGDNKPHTQYNRNYNNMGPYDILNYYYQVNECPQDMRPQTIVEISKALLGLIRHKPESVQGYTLDKVDFKELNGVPQIPANRIKNFILSIIIYFIRDHPYCSFEGVLKLVQFHVRQNRAIYYKNGFMNVQLFKLHGILDGLIDTSSKFYQNIQKTLQTTMTVFMNQFCSIVKCIPRQQSDQLLAKPEIVTNLMIAFKALYNADYVFIHLNYAHEQVGLQLMNILLIIHRRCPSAFDKRFVRECIQYLDTRFYLISKNPRAFNPFHEDKSTSTLLGKKCIQLVNCLVLRFPYQLATWDPEMKKMINSTKSQWMFPFKWLLTDKLSNQMLSSSSRYDNQQTQAFNRTQYFTILGREWLLLLKALIRNEKDHTSLSINQYYKDTVFYLLCSVIEENPFNFWTDSEQNKQLYEYITNIYLEVGNNNPDSPAARLGLGKLCRIMLCACGKSMVGENSSEISQQILNSFKQDSILFGALRESENSTSTQGLQLCNYVYNYFVNNIINSRGITKQKLFGPLILGAIAESSQSYQQEYLLYDLIGSVDPTKLKYHYELPTAAYELIIRIVNDNPNLLFVLAPLWDREYENLVQRDEDNQSEQSSKVMMNTFLWKITFDYMIKVEEYCSTNKHTNQNQSADSVKMRQHFQVVPLALQLLNSMLKNKHTRQLAIDFLQEEHIYNNQRLRQVLQKSVIFQNNVDAIARHIQTMYELDIYHIPWIARTCNSVIQQSFDLWEIDVVKHYANVVRIVITQKYLESSSKYASNWSNLLSLDPHNELLGSSLKGMDSYNIKIHELNLYSQYLLPFIIWALKVEEDNLHEYYFYNSLYINRKYDTLGSALKLLQVLVVIYIRYHDRVYIPEKLKRFLSIFNASRQFSMSMQTLAGSGSSSTVNQQIELSNKKVATLPAVLTYLISSPTQLSPSQFKQHSYPKARQVRSIALNILTMIISANSSMSSILSTLQEKRDNQMLLWDSISSINFNVYESMFVNDYQKPYCSAKQFLIDHINKQICNSNKMISVPPLPWFQSSYNYGQLIDIATQINSLFTSPLIREALIQRVMPQLREGPRLGQEMRKMLTRNARNASIYAIATSPQLLPSWLTNYQCDRQVSAYSRYALQLAACYSSTSTSSQFENLFIMIMDFIANRLLELIIEAQDCQDKQRVIESISLNFWKTIRALQTKKNLRLFTTVIKNYMPFILHYYHLNISSPEYVREYMIGIRLVLACKEYLPSNLFAEVQGVLKIIEILVNLMRKSAERPSFYTVLFYCLNFYTQLMKKQRSRGNQRNWNPDDAQSSLFDHTLSQNKQFVEQLRSLYLIVNQTINPANSNLKKSSLGRKSIKIQKQTKNLNELSKDVTIISLMMFFKLYIPHQMETEGYSGQQSLYELLFNSDQSNHHVGFNFKSLLLNIQTNPTRKSIQLALKIGNESRHYIQFVSVCNHLYKALAQERTYSHDGLIQQILAFIQRILDLQITTNASKYNQTWINLAYMKSWACNLLYVMMGYSASETLMIKISDIAFASNNMLSLLGELLSIFGECEIKWPWAGTRTTNLSKLDLLEKELLHSILKLYMSLFAKVDKWNKRSNSQATSKNTAYLTFCKAIISGCKLLNKNPGTVINHNQYGDRVLRNATVPSSSAKTQYEQTLQRITLQSIYSQYIARDIQNRPPQNPQAQINAVQLSKIRVIHPQCSNVLDLIHEHYNMLITEKYLMIMQGSYLNPQLILDTYEFNDILFIFENSSKKIIEINNNERTFHEAMNKIHRDVWRSFRMNTNLYYLNTIQESPKDTVDILNSISEVCVNSIVTLRGSMEMHQDFRQFYIKADKIMRQARKASSIYSFDIKNYIEQGGFEHKSQYGQSFMLSPSTMRVGR